jgi:hypothetical protein
VNLADGSRKPVPCELSAHRLFAPQNVRDADANYSEAEIAESTHTKEIDDEQ